MYVINPFSNKFNFFTLLLFLYKHRPEIHTHTNRTNTHALMMCQSDRGCRMRQFWGSVPCSRTPPKCSGGELTTLQLQTQIRIDRSESPEPATAPSQLLQTELLPLQRTPTAVTVQNVFVTNKWIAAIFRAVQLAAELNSEQLELVLHTNIIFLVNWIEFFEGYSIW